LRFLVMLAIFTWHRYCWNKDYVNKTTFCQCALKKFLYGLETCSKELWSKIVKIATQANFMEKLPQKN